MFCEFSSKRILTDRELGASFKDIHKNNKEGLGSTKASKDMGVIGYDLSSTGAPPAEGSGPACL